MNQTISDDVSYAKFTRAEITAIGAGSVDPALHCKGKNLLKIMDEAAYYDYHEGIWYNAEDGTVLS